jgi:DNA polymerase-3 subunit alpha
LSTREDHTYYKPRLTFDEFLNISDNVIKISACVQSPLNKFKDDDVMLEKLLKHYDYYEIQYHNMEEQIEFNKWLYNKSKEYNKPLIVGTDTHSLNDYKAKCRTILQYGKTDGAWGDGENECDLTYKSYNELVDCFKTQNSLPMDIVLEAIENTNKMADSVEELTFDTKDKYPLLYGEKDEEVLWNTLRQKYIEKVKRGEIDGNNLKYAENIKEEMRVFKKINMIGFMLFMSEIMSWARENGIATGFSRGSVGGSTVAYISDITDIDPVKWNTVFSRFANENRIEAGDIDTDWYEDDRQKVYNYIIDRFGLKQTSYILAVGTLADKAVIDTIGKAFRIKYGDKTQYTLAKIKEIKEEYDKNPEKTKEKYSDLFYYYDGLKGCVVSQSQHPAGIIVSPITLADNYGMFYGKDGQEILPIDMEECHEMGLIKFDLLGLKSVGVIDKTYKLIGKHFPRAYEIDWQDEEVFKSISNDSTMIFQFESDFARQSIKKMQPRSVDDICLCSACLRPSGESYRDDVFAHKWHKNPSKLIDDILSNSFGQLVYQEQTIAFLQQVCGFSGSEADNIRRAIGKKDREKIAKALPQILNGYCDKSDKPREIAKEEAKGFIKVIEDASGYSFGFNHSESYAMLGYLMGWLRYYYPVEFCTSFLNCAKNDEDLENGTKYAKSQGIKIENPIFRFSTSEYGCDSANKIIYKGVSSIKNIGRSCADNLYTLKDNKYNNFVDLLYDIKTNSLCNKTEIEILIKLNYFREFGNINKLFFMWQLFNRYYGKKQINKKAMAEYTEFEQEAIKKFSGKECASIYKELDSKALLDYLADHIKLKDLSEEEKACIECKYLGYTDICVSNSPYSVCNGLEVNQYGTTFVSLYDLNNGSTTEYKANRQWVKQYPLQVGDLVRPLFKTKPRMVYNAETKKYDKTGETYEELNSYSYQRTRF